MTDLPYSVRLMPASDAVIYQAPLRFASAEDRDEFFGNWAGVHDNLGISPPVEGVDYELINDEGN